MTKTIIVLGAGLGGLATGIYAQINGFKTSIFEKNSVPGGLAACWKRKQYLIDGGIHFLSGYKPGLNLYNVFKEVGAHKAECIDLDIYARFIDEESNRNIDISADLIEFQKNLTTLFPKDIGVIKHFIKGIRGLSKSDFSEFGFKNPPELMTTKDWIKDFWENRKSLRYFVGKSMMPVKEYVTKIHDPMFRELLLYMFLPDIPIVFLWMVLSLVSQKQMGVLKNGSIDFARKMVDRFVELGGQIHYDSKVSDILVKDDKVTGIVLEDGSVHNSDFCISAIDGFTVIFKMLKGKYLNENIERRYKKWKVVDPFVSVNFGVNMEFKDDVWMTFIKTTDPINVGNKEKNFVLIRFFNYSKSFAPEGKTVIQVDFETDWEYWFELRKDITKYREAKKQLSKEVLSWLEKRYPGISNKIEVTDVATPYTYWRYTLNQKGAYMGFLPTTKSFVATVEKQLPGLENFYMAGQWSMSMGGVQPVIYSGKHVIQLLCNNEGQEFVTKDD
ncbi:MAG: NAD(P)/FAD-dependent oxidoreductase [Asgard group archaeon]|nr:NAD(P)/FAD-dependent oxidoreductase [Asgard group archaeon]